MTKVIGEYDDRGVSLLAIDQYCRQVQWTPPVSQEEETELLERVRRGTGTDGSLSPDALAARDRLVEGYQWLVLAIARRSVRRFRSLDVSDLAQEGNLGLLKAIQLHDRVSVRCLESFAAVCIYQAISRAWAEDDGDTRFPWREQRLLRVIEQAQARLREDTGREPSVRELAQVTQMKEAQVFDLLMVPRLRRVESVQVLCERAEMTDEHLDFVSLFESALRCESWRSERVRQAVETALTKHQRQVIGLRFGLDEQGQCQTSWEVAARLGVCQRSVSLVEQGARGRLARVLAPVAQAAHEEEVEATKCVVCGAPVVQRGTSRLRVYCGQACYLRAYERRKRVQPEQGVA